MTPQSIEHKIAERLYALLVEHADCDDELPSVNKLSSAVRAELKEVREAAIKLLNEVENYQDECDWPHITKAATRLRAVMGEVREMKYDNKQPDLLPNEPWFLIRGRDFFAVDSIRAYADLSAKESSKHAGQIGDDLMKHALQILRIAERIQNWQQDNKDQVRFPKPEAKEPPHAR